MSRKGRVRSSPYSAKRGDRDAYPTDHDDTGFGPLRATVLKARLAACPGACGGRDPRSGQEDRELRPASYGLGRMKAFCRYHRVLSRAVWSSQEASRILLDSLVEAFVAEGAPLVVGVDETLERRRGKKIAAKGIYRDPVSSSHSHLVKTSALRWVCVTLLAEIPWASRVWALPFLSALAPSERYAQEHGKRHKSSPNGRGSSAFGQALVSRARDRGRRRRRVCFPEAPRSLPELCENPSPSSPVFGWTPPSTSRPRRAIPVR